MTDPRYQPVVAIDMDGTLRVGADPQKPLEARLFSRAITMRREEFPSLFHHEPEWDARGEWTHTHVFSGVGASWVQGLLRMGVEVVWATTWQEHANTYFAGPLGFPELPVAVTGNERGSGDSTLWKAEQLARQFDGRPLLWVDDAPILSMSASLPNLRLEADRPLTRFYWVRDWSYGISPIDASIMDEWVRLTRTPDGHQELQRRHNATQTRATDESFPDRSGREARYVAWAIVRDRLRTVLGEDSVLPEMIAHYATDHPDGTDTDVIANMVEEWESFPVSRLDKSDLLLRIVRILGAEGYDVGGAP